MTIVGLLPQNVKRVVKKAKPSSRPMQKRGPGPNIQRNLAKHGYAPLHAAQKRHPKPPSSVRGDFKVPTQAQREKRLYRFLTKGPLPRYTNTITPPAWKELEKKQISAARQRNGVLRMSQGATQGSYYRNRWWKMPTTKI